MRIAVAGTCFAAPVADALREHGFSPIAVTADANTPRRMLQMCHEPDNALISALRGADMFLIVLGLTEAWTHRATGAVYANASGEYDPAVHVFHNFTFAEVHHDLRDVMAIARRERPGIHFLFVVSPVPLTATASGEHVLTATTYSKSVLRAAAAQLRTEGDDADYYPLYEIVAAAPARKAFEANRRTVSTAGLALAMAPFLAAHGMDSLSGGVGETRPRRRARRAREQAHCDAVLDSARE